MKVKAIIKKWIDGKFIEVASHYTEDIQQIKHHKNGFEIIVAEGYSLNNTKTILYDNDCIIEFKIIGKEEGCYTTIYNLNY